MKAPTLPLRPRVRARDGGGNQRPWPADKVERWGIERLIPYAKNARGHPDAQVAAIAASIKEWGGTTTPPVPRIQAPPASDSMIAGDGRVRARRAAKDRRGSY